MRWPASLLERQEPQPDGCIIYTGPRTQNGYGLVSRGKVGTKTTAHRAMYELKIGPIPEGLELDHLCRTRLCVNLEHLELVTHRENTLRGKTTLGAINSAKTHCPQGHPYDDENTIINNLGRRICRKCRKVIKRRSYLKRKAETS